MYVSSGAGCSTPSLRNKNLNATNDSGGPFRVADPPIFLFVFFVDLLLNRRFVFRGMAEKVDRTRTGTSLPDACRSVR